MTEHRPHDAKSVVAERIQRSLDQRGWSAARLAREAGVSPSTVTRALDPQVPFVPSTRTLQKLGRFFDAARGDENRNDLADKLNVSDRGAKALISQVSRLAAKYNQVPLVGRVRPGTWQLLTVNVLKVDELTEGQGLHLRHPQVPSGSLGYRFEGDAPDNDFKPGELLIVDVDAKPASLEIGDIAVLRRRIVSMALEETTVGTVRRGGSDLAFEGRDGKADLLMLGRDMDIETIFVGRVVATFRAL